MEATAFDPLNSRPHTPPPSSIVFYSKHLKINLIKQLKKNSFETLKLF